MGGDRAQCFLCTTHLHTPCRGLPVFPPPCNPWVLYGTPGLLFFFFLFAIAFIFFYLFFFYDTRASDGSRYPENPGEAEHVPQGAPVPGPCWGPMVWGLKV